MESKSIVLEIKEANNTDDNSNVHLISIAEWEEKIITKK